MRIEGLRDIVALEMWCVSRSDRPRALAEWPTMLDIDKAHYYQLTDAALAAVAPLIAAQERKRITEALHAEADATPCAEDAAVVRDCADLVEADFSYERAEEIAAIRALKETRP